MKRNRIDTSQTGNIWSVGCGEWYYEMIYYVIKS